MIPSHLVFSCCVIKSITIFRTLYRLNCFNSNQFTHNMLIPVQLVLVKKLYIINKTITKNIINWELTVIITICVKKTSRLAMNTACNRSITLQDFDVHLMFIWWVLFSIKGCPLTRAITYPWSLWHEVTMWCSNKVFLISDFLKITQICYFTKEAHDWNI